MARNVEVSSDTDKATSSKDGDPKIVIQFPNIITIEMVPANELKLYERIQWLATISAPIAAGFWTAYLADTRQYPLLWSALGFTVFTLIFIGAAYFQRRKVFLDSVTKTASMKDFK